MGPGSEGDGARERGRRGQGGRETGPGSEGDGARERGKRGQGDKLCSINRLTQAAAFILQPRFVKIYIAQLGSRIQTYNYIRLYN